VIKSWLTAPVIERDQRAVRCTTEAKDRHRGTPQGSPISPLLANLYFRRFLLAWERFGHRKRLDAYVVNYADDFVICCRPANGPAALMAMRQLMMRLGLTVNEAKTRLVRLPEQSFDFLGYTIGRFYGKDGAPYIGTRPSGRLSGACSNGFTTRRRRTSMPKAQNYGLSPSIGFSAAGPRTSTKGRFFQPTSWCVGMFNGVFNDGWCDAADKRAPDIANIRTSISTRRLASMPCRVGVPTCRARRRDDAGESRMRKICTSGLTSDD
jgi:hypothetical protein